MQKIEISGTPPNLTVKVDGVLLPVTSADLHVDCQSVPQLTVSIPGFDTDIDTEGDVQVDEFAARILRALGWLPPGEPTGIIKVDGELTPEAEAALRRKTARIAGQGIPFA
jgi:hypothetical protein